MAYGSPRRRSRRAVKVGIAAAAALAAGGALFAAQAGAATVRTKDVRVKVPEGICAMNVFDGLSHTASFRWPGSGWRGGWVNTHLQAQVGDVVRVQLSDMCNDGLGPGVPVSALPKFQVDSRPSYNAWFDATHAPRLY